MQATRAQSNEEILEIVLTMNFTSDPAENETSSLI